MSKDGYFAISSGLAAIIWAVLNTMYPKIPLLIGWPVVALLGIICFVLVAMGLRSKEKNERKVSSLYKIIPILQKMEQRNTELSHEHDIKFNYDIITEDYIDVLGFRLNIDSLNDIPKMVAEFEAYINANYPEGIYSLDSSQIILTCAVFECRGFDLRKQRTNDNNYKKLLAKLDQYRNEVTDTTLNNLIQLHVYTSNYYSSLLLVNNVPESKKREYIQKLPQKWRVLLQSGDLELELHETLNDIRVKIGERIKELENNKTEK